MDLSHATPKTAALQRPCFFGFPFHLPSSPFLGAWAKCGKKTDRDKSERRQIPRTPERQTQIWGEGASLGILLGKTLRSILGRDFFTQHTFSTPYQTGLKALERREDLQADPGIYPQNSRKSGGKKADHSEKVGQG